MPLTAAELPKFTTHPAKFIPTVFGGHVLVYESRSHPGHRREFAFKTRFTNQSGVSSCYYRCMSCRSMKNKVPPGPDGKPPQIPCIAVKNGFIVNDPDFPEANDHFCTPPTIEESKEREANGFAKSIVKGRPRQKARTAKPAPKRQPYLTQMQALQEMTNALKNEGNASIFDVSGLSIDQSLLAASTSGLLGTPNGEFTDGVRVNGFIEDESIGMHSKEVKLEDDDSDGTVKANNLLASLISSEPALRSGITLSHKAIAAPETSTEGLIDACQEYRRSPESYNALVLSSIQPTNPVFSSGNSSLQIALTNGRKRKSSSPIENFESLLEESADRYIINNWDLPENENAGNSRSITELTCCFILSLARNVSQGDAAMKKGKWSRKDLMGEEVFGKTLAVIGLGRIGMEVAYRMQAFGMYVIGYDPYIEAEAAVKKGIKWLPLEHIWPVADYITVHVPLIPQTQNLISAKTLRQCKKGVKIINVARGGIVNEIDLVESIDGGHVSGAALDVFSQEPPSYREILEHPKVICTPHLGASTFEAHQRQVKEINGNGIAFTNGNGYSETVNGPSCDVVSNKEKAFWVRAVGILAKIAAVLSNASNALTIRYPMNGSSKETESLEKALRLAAIVGVLHTRGVLDINLLNAELHAKKEGLQILVEQKFDEMVTVTAGGSSVSGYATQQGVFITSFNSSRVPVALLAVGTIAVNLDDNPNFGEMSEAVKAKLCVEFGLIGGGRVALFSSLNGEEVDELSKLCSVINFI